MLWQSYMHVRYMSAGKNMQQMKAITDRARTATKTTMLDSTWTTRNPRQGGPRSACEDCVPKVAQYSHRVFWAPALTPITPCEQRLRRLAHVVHYGPMVLVIVKAAIVAVMTVGATALEIAILSALRVN